MRSARSCSSRSPAALRGCRDGSAGRVRRRPRPSRRSIRRKRSFEADLAASEKARLQAEQRATTRRRGCDPRACGGRSRRDAREAETEAGAHDQKRRCSSEMAALRAQAAQEAGRTRAADAEAISARRIRGCGAEIEVGNRGGRGDERHRRRRTSPRCRRRRRRKRRPRRRPPRRRPRRSLPPRKPPRSRSAPVAGDSANRYDGVWSMKFDCAAYRNAPAEHGAEPTS